MTEDLAKYKDTFLSEAREHVALMNDALLKLEKNPSRISSVGDIFRAAHTLKSMASAMNYNKTAELCHATEDVLDALKKRKIRLMDCVDILFESFDTLDSILKKLKENREEIDTTQLVEKLQQLATKKIAEISQERREEVFAIAPAEKIQTIEVKVEKLDLLMNLAEELLIIKMRLDRIKEELQSPELTAAVDNLRRLVSEIQYNVMQSRLVPVGFVFNRFPRMVRDLAKQQKKEVHLETEGGDIELDRSVIDEISESLVHLIRNAVDHGIELPEVRQKSGKSPLATIRLSAARTKGFAIIKVSDDGAGLDMEAIRNAAVKLGILSLQASEEEVINSIFSGVSSTRQVTAVSGRGFGLNIVKNKIESIGGEIKIESEPKKGTAFTIEIPLTLAIIKSLFVRVGDKTYAIPLVNIKRLVIVDRRDIKGMVNYEAIVLNGEEILITRLNKLFCSPPLNLERLPIVIVSKGRDKIGLAVDGLLATQEIVIKPLNRLVKENRYFSGSTIIGSGEVVLILDVANLILSKRDILSEKRKGEENAS